MTLSLNDLNSTFTQQYRIVAPLEVFGVALPFSGTAPEKNSLATQITQSLQGQATALTNNIVLKMDKLPAFLEKCFQANRKLGLNPGNMETAIIAMAEQMARQNGINLLSACPEIAKEAAARSAHYEALAAGRS